MFELIHCGTRITDENISNHDEDDSLEEGDEEKELEFVEVDVEDQAMMTTAIVTKSEFLIIKKK